VFAGGVFDVPLASFVSAITLARAIRYFGIGYLAIRYGKNALPFLKDHKLEVTVGILAFVLLSYGASRLILRKRERQPGVTST
jgi:membrane protein DedA with SNARE-associated domain